MHVADYLVLGQLIACMLGAAGSFSRVARHNRGVGRRKKIFVRFPMRPLVSPMLPGSFFRETFGPGKR